MKRKLTIIRKWKNINKYTQETCDISSKNKIWFLSDEKLLNHHIDMSYNLAKCCLLAIVLNLRLGGNISHVLKPQ